jgi:hypothetical protein
MLGECVTENNYGTLSAGDIVIAPRTPVCALLMTDSFNFMLPNGAVALRLTVDGCYVNGEKVDSSKEVYEAFKAWVEMCRAVSQVPR